MGYRTSVNKVTFFVSSEFSFNLLASAAVYLSLSFSPSLSRSLIPVPGAVKNMNIQVINSSAVVITWDDPTKPNGAFIYYVKVQQWNLKGKKPITVISYNDDNQVTVTGLSKLSLVWTNSR